MIDPDYARKHSPTGEVLQHPIFVTALGFYCIGAEGLGSWIRSPGARNPGQRIEIMEPFRNGEKITATITTADKFVQRGKHYLQMLIEFRNEAGTLKATWLCSLILPPTRADLEKFARI
jgi:acyl dehydratase